MNATGIVRRIDDLGRVAIPKEIRRTMHIKESDPLVIFTTDEGIVLQKYDITNDLKAEAEKWLQDHKDAMDKQGVRFSIQGRTTTCEGICRGSWVSGSATCNPDDTYVPAIGMVYAYCRAYGLATPDQW